MTKGSDIGYPDRSPKFVAYLAPFYFVKNEAEVSGPCLQLW
jgi:hypothetical protein